MDRRIEYRHLIKRLLCEYERLYNLRSSADMETFVVFDEERDHYLLLRYGWEHDSRVHRAILYVRLRNGKFWIEEDWTEDGIATRLLEAGVPKEDIVLAFQPPELRPLTEFAAA